METHANAPVVRQSLEAQAIEPRRHLPRVVEDGHVHTETIRDPPELALREQRMAIAEAPARVRPQGAAAAE
jgi:hypothetical protein